MNYSIASKPIGPDQPPYIIAEIGSNHNGDLALARRMIDEAIRCGADAVKFQSWSTTSLISKGEYRRNTDYSDKERHFGSLYEMVDRYQLTPQHHHEMSDYCKQQGIHFLSSAFSPEEVDLLVELDVPAIKIASMDVTHPVLLAYAAQTQKPIILSTGLATLTEIAAAVEVLRENNCEQLILLHCVSLYPPEFEDINLRNIEMLQQTFGVPVGLSDHSLGTSIPVAATALGACVIEKHYTLDRSMPGWDHWMSVEPDELEVICTATKQVHTALGTHVRSVSDAEIEKRKKFRRSIVAKIDIPAGTKLQLEHLDFKRPGTGISPSEYRFLFGRTTRVDLQADMELEWAQLE